MVKKQIQAKNSDVKFAKEKILNMKKYCEYADLLGAILENESVYSMHDIDKAIAEFMKKQI